MSVNTFITNKFAPIIGLIFLLLVLMKNDTLTKRETHILSYLVTGTDRIDCIQYRVIYGNMGSSDDVSGVLIHRWIFHTPIFTLSIYSGSSGYTEQQKNRDTSFYSGSGCNCMYLHCIFFRYLFFL